MKRRSLQWRLTAALFAVAVLAVAVVAALAAGVTARQFGTYVEHGPLAMMQHRIGTEVIQGYVDAGGWGKADALAKRLGNDFRARVVIADAAGRVLADSDPSGPPPNGMQDLVLNATRIGSVAIGPVGEGTEENIFLSTTYRWLAVGALLAAILALAVGSWVSRRLTAGLKDLTDASRKMAAGELEARVDAAGHDEVAELGLAFNEMAESVQRSERLRRRLIGDVAHELRTPIATLRSRLEALRDGVLPTDEGTLASLSDEVLVLSSLVDDLQELSLAESGQLTYDKTELDLSSLAADEAERFRVGLEARDVGLVVECSQPLTVSGDPKRLGQVVRNLVDNAAKHTDSGSITVRCGEVGARDRDPVRAQEDGSAAKGTAGGWGAIEVIDTGAGIAPGDLPFIFERFYRADAARARRRGGAGIGLTIARRIVEAHGGRIEAESTVDRGTTVSVVVPLHVSGTAVPDGSQPQAAGGRRAARP